MTSDQFSHAKPARLKLSTHLIISIASSAKLWQYVFIRACAECPEAVVYTDSLLLLGDIRHLMLRGGAVAGRSNELQQEDTP